jgi:acyl-CoA reductase-like NAD-dependent aldehyde dehydrogenase
VLRADDFDHALALANDSDYALTGGSSRARPRDPAAVGGVRAANFYVNRAITGAAVGRQPFGGSGCRRRVEGGRAGLSTAVRRAARRDGERDAAGVRGGD